MRLLAVALLVLCAARTSGVEAATHRTHGAKHATAKHATKTKRQTAARHPHVAPARPAADDRADEPAAEPETKPAAVPGAAAAQAVDSEDPPVRQRRK
jgi:hypothetical protein